MPAKRARPRSGHQPDPANREGARRRGIEGAIPAPPVLGPEAQSDAETHEWVGRQLEALATPADAEVLDLIGPQPVAAKAVLEIARALGLDIWMSALDRIEIDGINELPPRLRSEMTFFILLFCRSIGDLLLKEAGATRP